MTEANGSHDLAMNPEFVILGVPNETGVTVIASTELNQAELSYEAEYERDHPDLHPRLVQERHTLTTEMRGYVQVTAPTYPEALRLLFEQWSPDDRQDAPALTTGVFIEDPCAPKPSPEVAGLPPHD